MKEILRRIAPKSVAYAAYFKALFENEIELRLLSWLCDPSRVSIDAGAFTGLYSIGESFFSKAVIAVEPQNAQAELLRRSMPPPVSVVEAALSNASGKGVLKMESLAGGSMSTLDRDSMLVGPGVEVEVQTLRLDDLAKQRVGFMKIDVEGHELQVLQGARRILNDDRPALLIEAEERNRPEAVALIAGFLADFSYDGYFVHGGKILPLSEFDAKTRQNPRLITGGKRRNYRDYINNFIFIPRDWPCRLPEQAPTGARSVFLSLSPRKLHALSRQGLTT